MLVARLAPAVSIAIYAYICIICIYIAMNVGMYVCVAVRLSYLSLVTTGSSFLEVLEEAVLGMQL